MSLAFRKGRQHLMGHLMTNRAQAYPSEPYPRANPLPSCSSSFSIASFSFNHPSCFMLFNRGGDRVEVDLEVEFHPYPVVRHSMSPRM